MSKTYVIRNQLGQYATRKGEWISGRETVAVAHFVHHDQAVNQLFELGIKDIYLRGRVEDVALNEAGKPVIKELGPEPEAEMPSANQETIQVVQEATHTVQETMQTAQETMQTVQETMQSTAENEAVC